MICSVIRLDELFLKRPLMSLVLDAITEYLVKSYFELHTEEVLNLHGVSIQLLGVTLAYLFESPYDTTSWRGRGCRCSCKWTDER